MDNTNCFNKIVGTLLTIVILKEVVDYVIRKSITEYVRLVKNEGS